MNNKIFPITESMKQSKCDELLRNIKKLAGYDKGTMSRYLDIKADIKKLYKERNDKGLQDCFYFIAGTEDSHDRQ